MQATVTTEATIKAETLLVFIYGNYDFTIIYRTFRKIAI